MTYLVPCSISTLLVRLLILCPVAGISRAGLQLGAPPCEQYCSTFTLCICTWNSERFRDLYKSMQLYLGYPIVINELVDINIAFDHPISV